METAVEVRDARKTYGETTALDGVSLSIATGEVFGLLGPNGAGKTTLVRAVTGTTELDDGEVTVFDARPRSLDPARLGVLPQQYAPPERLTGRELVEYFAGLYEEASDPESVLASVGMADDADTWYERLSGGQQRRVCLGIALVNDPDLLVLDEPTTGIDPAGRRAVRERIGDLAAGGTTVVVTGHDVEEIERLADRVGMLADGELVAAGSPGSLVAEHGGPARLLVETGATGLEGYEVTAVEAGLVFEDVDPGELGEVVATLADRGVEYDALRWSRPDLEDVYLELTGRPDLVGAVGAGDLNRTAAVAGDAPGGSEERRSDEREADRPGGGEGSTGGEGSHPDDADDADAPATGGDR